MRVAVLTGKKPITPPAEVHHRIQEALKSRLDLKRAAFRSAPAAKVPSQGTEMAARITAPSDEEIRLAFARLRGK